MLNNKSAKDWRNQKGSLVVMFAILLPVIFGCVGIAFDIGMLYVEKAKLQNYADAAAYAGLVELKQADGFVSGSDGITAKLPLASVSDDTLDELKEKADASADEYLLKNSRDRHFLIENGGAQTKIYRLVTGEDSSYTTTTYYYEVIVLKTYPLTFSRIIYPHDITVRAGAVCKLDIRSEREVITYAKARELWGSVANTPKTNLLETDSAQRLDADIEGLTNMANLFMGMSKDTVRAYITNANPNNSLLGHYTEETGVSTYSNSLMEMNTFVSMLSGKLEGEVYDPTQRYLFSDYAATHVDGTKIWLKYEDNVVTGVRVAINPADAANGSEPLSVKLGNI